MLLEDRVAIITGGAGVNGLGFGTARMMAVQGARIVILDLERTNPAQADALLGSSSLGVVAGVLGMARSMAREFRGMLIH